MPAQGRHDGGGSNANGPALALPAREARYYTAATDVAFVRNNRETGGRGVDIVLARPGQVKPPGATVVRVEGARGIALVRILVEDGNRFVPIDRARRAATCGPV